MQAIGCLGSCPCPGFRIQAASSFAMLELSYSTVRFQNPEIHKLDFSLYFYFKIIGDG
jgi:hypothetical protein